VWLLEKSYSLKPRENANLAMTRTLKTGDMSLLLHANRESRQQVFAVQGEPSTPGHNDKMLFLWPRLEFLRLADPDSR
jgi:hypothetical protein